MLDNQTTAAASLTLPRNKPQWVDNLALHDSLMRAYDADERRKTDLARRLKNRPRATSAPSTRGVRLRVLPPHIRKHDAEPEPLVHDSLMHEYAVLTKRQKSRRVAIRRVEKLILSARPKSHAQAVLLLDFLSRMVAARRRFNRRDIAAAMHTCAVALAQSTVLKPELRIVS